jgi:hypothetical protein
MKNTDHYAKMIASQTCQGYTLGGPHAAPNGIAS